MLLTHKARRLRKETGHPQYYSPLEADKQPFAHRVKKVLGTPFEMLAKEPILQALTVYMSVCPSNPFALPAVFTNRIDSLCTVASICYSKHIRLVRDGRSLFSLP